MMLMVLISLAAGVLTVLAPCVLPLLPVIIGGSLAAGQHNRSRPYIIAGSLVIAVVGFTLILKVSTLAAGISEQILDIASGGLLVLLGFALSAPELWAKMAALTKLEAVSNQLLSTAGNDRRPFIGAALIGLALGPVFASCSPTYAFILASVLPKDLPVGTLDLFAYAVGLAAALLAVALAGKRLTSRLGWALDPNGWFRRTFGAVLIVVGLVVAFGLASTVEVWVAAHLPFDEAKLEQQLLSTQTGTKTDKQAGSALNVEPIPAPQFTGLTNWINSPPLTLSNLRGQVVLVDFWTYSCINCIRTLPYLEKWYQTYHNQGLVIIGVNTPEFAFEHVPGNVAAAVRKFGIAYPVALDNNYATWDAYNNDSWPADYLIDRSGDIRYVATGEGDYPTTERAIQELLGINHSLVTPTSNVPVAADQTPETYFGTNRAQSYVGSPSLVNGSANFSPTQPSPDQWTLSGKWKISGESITSEGPGSQLVASVVAKDVYLVASGAGSVHVGLDPGSSSDFGNDAPEGLVAVAASRLYHIVSRPQSASITVTLTVPTGVTLYTFTFGS